MARMRGRTGSLQLPRVEGDDLRVQRAMTPRRSFSNQNDMHMKNFAGLQVVTTPSPTASSHSVSPSPTSPTPRRHSQQKSSLPAVRVSVRDNARKCSQPCSPSMPVAGNSGSAPRSRLLEPPEHSRRRALSLPSQDDGISPTPSDESKVSESLERRKSAADIDKEFEELLSQNFGGNVSVVCSERSSFASSVDCDNEGLPRLLGSLVGGPSSPTTCGADLVKEEHEVEKPLQEQRNGEAHLKMNAASSLEKDATGKDQNLPSYSQRMKGTVGRIAERLAGVRHQSRHLSITGDLQHDVGSIHHV